MYVPRKEGHLRFGELIAGRFQVESLAGVGGMGEVYRALDVSSGGETVALKILLDPSGAERFEREAHLLAGLRHPGIARYIDHGCTHLGSSYLVMEWLEGFDLEHLLDSTTLTITESIELTLRAAEALGAAHALGVVHRDVKPSNLFLVGGDLENVKVLDFGIARYIGAGLSNTRTGTFLGTPSYMAPEQARGDKTIDSRADVFSLGCVLFECLTGSKAFAAPDAMGVLAKILIEPSPRVSEQRPDVGPDLDDLVARMLSKDHERRPVDGRQVAAELRAFERVDDMPPMRSEHHGVISDDEQRLMSVILAAGEDSGVDEGDTIVDLGLSVEAPPTSGDPTVAGPSVPPTHIVGECRPHPAHQSSKISAVDENDATTNRAPLPSGSLSPSVDERVVEALRPFGAELVRLLDGTWMVSLAQTGLATDQARQAARCALAMRSVLPTVPMSLATGRGMVAARWPVGDVIDRAVAMLRRAGPAIGSGATPIRVDDVTVGLLDVRFDVGGDDEGLFLRGERDAIGAGRTLLGRPSPCVGRERELGVLMGLIEECFGEPRARAALIVGAAGVGKSRLRYELLRTIRDRGEEIEVWFAQGDPLVAGSPFGLISSAIRRAAGILESDSLDVKRRKLKARVARDVPDDMVIEVTEFVGEIIGAPFDEDGEIELRAARADVQLLNDRMRRAFEMLLLCQVCVGPLVLVLEDLQWGDLPSIRFIDSALRTLAERPFFVLAMARPEVRAVFPGLWVGRSMEELRLGELSRRGSEQLVRAVLSDQVDEETLARIVDRAAGNAFHIEELIRAVAEGKGDVIPETLLAVLTSRLERVEGEARRVLRAASVYGQVFWRGAVMALLSGTDRSHRFDAWLDELVEREVIVRREVSKFEGEEEFIFRHALVRDAAYAMLTEDDRRLGHCLAGSWLEKMGESEAVVLAEHFERGGQKESAIGWYLRAGEQALRGSDLASAIERARLGLSCGATGDARGALLRIQAEAHRWRGELAEAGRCAKSALASLPERSPAWFAAAEVLAEAAGKLDTPEELVKVGEMLCTPSSGTYTAAEASACANTAFQLFYAGCNAVASRLLDRIEQSGERVCGDDPVVCARVHQVRSSRAMFSGDVGVYLDEELRAALAFEEAGDLRNGVMQRGHVAYACQLMGDYEEAAKVLGEVIETGERLGLSSVVVTAKHNLGLVMALCGHVSTGLTLELEAFEAAHRQGDRRMEAGCREYLARIRLLAGDAAGAEREARASVDLATPSLKPLSQSVLSQALLALGRNDEALAVATDALRGLEELGEMEEGEAYLRLAYAEALLACASTAEAFHEAKIAVVRARDRVLAQAANISDLERRRGFIERVPENARILELAQDVLGS